MFILNIKSVSRGCSAIFLYISLSRETRVTHEEVPIALWLMWIFSDIPRLVMFMHLYKILYSYFNTTRTLYNIPLGFICSVIFCLLISVMLNSLRENC